MDVIYRHAGFVTLDNATAWEIFFWLGPELIALPTSIAVFCICRSLSKNSVTDEEDASLRQSATNSKKTEDTKVKVLDPKHFVIKII